jgi:imidazolonepropionase-like amidohydrolase
LSQYGPAELRAAVEEAHRHNLPITAHAHGTQSVADAVEAGVDGLEHVSFMTADGVDEAPPEIVRSIVEKRIVLGLTLGAVLIPGMKPPQAIASRLPALMANARKLCESGAPYTVGTDAGIAPIKPHDVLRWAAAHLGQLGIASADALRIMTSEAADACGLGHRKGRLSPGYDADILAVDGNPFDDPTALHNIRAVYCRGAAIR